MSLTGERRKVSGVHRLKRSLIPCDLAVPDAAAEAARRGDLDATLEGLRTWRPIRREYALASLPLPSAIARDASYAAAARKIVNGATEVPSIYTPAGRLLLAIGNGLLAWSHLRSEGRSPAYRQARARADEELERIERSVAAPGMCQLDLDEIKATARVAVAVLGMVHQSVGYSGTGVQAALEAAEYEAAIDLDDAAVVNQLARVWELSPELHDLPPEGLTWRLGARAYAAAWLVQAHARRGSSEPPNRARVEHHLAFVAEAEAAHQSSRAAEQRD